MGKVYPRMMAIRKGIESSNVTWKAEALKIHDARWTYLKSDMHMAGYALDPEYIEHDMTDEVQCALITITERMALRSETNRLISEGQERQMSSLTTDSDGVQKLV